MKDFITTLIKNIVDNPDEVQVQESTDETGRTVFLISVADTDMGRVIGKSGKVINAIRTIARIMAIRQGIRISVDVKDGRRPDSDTPAQEEDSATPDQVDTSTEAETPASEPEEVSPSKKPASSTTEDLEDLDLTKEEAAPKA